MKTKTFDCVEMKWAAQRRIREAVHGMSRAQELAWFREGAEEFERKLAEAKRKKQLAPPPQDS